jgi:hypothetical protein
VTAQNMRECRRCHRVGYRGFVPSGDYGWECSNDRACNRRAAKQVTTEQWVAMAHKLAASVHPLASCNAHAVSDPDPECPYCEDRTVYREYLRLCERAGLRRQEPGPLEAATMTARRVPIDELMAAP